MKTITLDDIALFALNRGHGADVESAMTMRLSKTSAWGWGEIVKSLTEVYEETTVSLALCRRKREQTTEIAIHRRFLFLKRVNIIIKRSE
jgi:hypothetical protein